MSDLRLEEIRPDHMMKYQTDRAREKPEDLWNQDGNELWRSPSAFVQSFGDR